jgi:hypothetical protein
MELSISPRQVTPLSSPESRSKIAAVIPRSNGCDGLGWIQLMSSEVVHLSLGTHKNPLTKPQADPEHLPIPAVTPIARALQRPPES